MSLNAYRQAPRFPCSGALLECFWIERCAAEFEYCGAFQYLEVANFVHLNKPFLVKFDVLDSSPYIRRIVDETYLIAMWFTLKWSF